MTATDRPEETFQIPPEVAELYEARFVPALFAEWAPRLVDVAGVRPGMHVLDVACGTGIVARTAADVVGPTGRVLGLDLNEAMLAVARRVRPDVEWHQGDAADLPFADSTFDAVLCQMALMFFPDRAGAVAEMRRVARPSGSVALCVPASLPEQPAYGPFVDLAARHAGPEAMSLLSTYWACGDRRELGALLEDSGLQLTETRTVRGCARFDSAEQFVATEVESTPLVERLSERDYDAIKTGARTLLAPFAVAGGGLEVPLVAHLAAARRI
jgi:ubiquinone/menaquinone biosynthesis C-methylase UbiE